MLISIFFRGVSCISTPRSGFNILIKYDLAEIKFQGLRLELSVRATLVNIWPADLYVGRGIPPFLAAAVKPPQTRRFGMHHGPATAAMEPAGYIFYRVAPCPFFFDKAFISVNKAYIGTMSSQ